MVILTFAILYKGIINLLYVLWRWTTRSWRCRKNSSLELNNKI